MEELNNARINQTNFNTGSKFETMADNPYL
jgi:hypothetical protein